MAYVQQDRLTRQGRVQESWSGKSQSEGNSIWADPRTIRSDSRGEEERLIHPLADSYQYSTYDRDMTDIESGLTGPHTLSRNYGEKKETDHVTHHLSQCYAEHPRPLGHRDNTTLCSVAVSACVIKSLECIKGESQEHKRCINAYLIIIRGQRCLTAILP